jgi:hypothetical protein
MDAGGKDSQPLFITANKSLYRLKMRVQGAGGPVTSDYRQRYNSQIN